MLTRKGIDMVDFARHATRAQVDYQVRAFVESMIAQQLDDAELEQLSVSLGNEGRKIRTILYPVVEPQRAPCDRLDALGITVGFGALVALLFLLHGLVSAAWSWWCGVL